MTNNRGKLLVGAKAIISYLGISEHLFRKFIESGLPAMLLDGRWYAHTDNIDDYFKALTKKSLKQKIPPESVKN